VGAGTCLGMVVGGGGGIAALQQLWGWRWCHRRHLQHVLFPWAFALLVGGCGSGCLPGSCLPAASTSPSPPVFSSFPSLSPSPSPSFPSPSFIHKLSGSVTQLSFSCEVGGCGGLVVSTVTGRLCGGGDATPTRVASWDVLTVVGVGEWERCVVKW